MLLTAFACLDPRSRRQGVQAADDTHRSSQNREFGCMKLFECQHCGQLRYFENYASGVDTSQATFRNCPF